jgi:PAS domain S-box-containing protein
MFSRGFTLEAMMDPGQVALRSFDHIPAMVAYWDADQRCVFSNEAYRAWFGRGATDLTGITMAELLGPMFERNRPYIERALAGERQVFTRRLRRPDGRTKDALVTYAPDRVNGAVVGCVEHVVNVTRMRAREAALSRATELLDSTGELARVGGAELDLRTNESFWTREMFRILDVDPSTPPPSDRWIQFFPPEGVPAFLAASQALRASGVPCDFEAPMITAKGRRIWVRIRSSAVMEDGKVVKLVSAHQDITDRKQAESDMVLQAAALSATAIPMMITDHDGVVVWVNAAFTECTGYGAAEALGMNPRDLMKSGVHDPAFYGDLWRTIKAGKVWHGEVTNRRKDGTLYPELQTITPVTSADGRITHFISVKRDVSKDKQLEAQFLQAQKMETVGRLAGGIAHDFNNLLTVIIGTVDFLLAKVEDSDPAAADLGSIKAAGARAAVLTRQLLAFSRKQIMRLEVLDVNAAIEGVRPMLQRLIGKDVRLAFELAESVGHVRADAGQLEHVIMNLAVNARDAMPEGGTLTIRTQDVELDADFAARHPSVEPGHHIMVAFSDTGVGMSEGTRDRIFEPFFTTKELGRGTGLGLSTVYGIVKQSGGSIWVESEPGRGTVFKIYFPRADTSAAARTPPPTPPRGTGTETVLIVDDDQALVRVAARALRAAGYDVLTATDAGEAVRVLEQLGAQVNLLLTDLVLPDINGRELAIRMATAHPGLRVLITSGYADDTILQHGLIDPTVHFIAKPYTVAALGEMVRMVLDAPPTFGGPAD